MIVLTIILACLYVPLAVIALSLYDIAKCCKKGVLQMRDVDRASVYSKHLGEKLRS